MGEIRVIAWACVVANGKAGGFYCGCIYRAPMFTVSCDVKELPHFPDELPDRPFDLAYLGIVVP